MFLILFQSAARGVAYGAAKILLGPACEDVNERVMNYLYPEHGALIRYEKNVVKEISEEIETGDDWLISDSIDLATIRTADEIYNSIEPSRVIKESLETKMPWVES